jgi:hypothetical protein
VFSPNSYVEILTTHVIVLGKGAEHLGDNYVLSVEMLWLSLEPLKKGSPEISLALLLPREGIQEDSNVHQNLTMLAC